MAQPPSNFTFDQSTATLSWDPSPDGDFYEVEYSSDEGENWKNIYQGGYTSCPFPLPIGTYLVRGKARVGGGSFGPYSPPKKINVA